MHRPVRSFLFIPGDSEKKLAKADAIGADAIVLDLEDAVAAERKAAAREMVAEFLRDRPRENRKAQLWVRINPADTPMAMEDITAVAGGAPDGIMQPKINRPDDVRGLSNQLATLEKSSGVAAGSIRILPVAAETAASPFHLGEFAGAGIDRMSGLTWGAEDLAAAIGADGNKDANGDWSFTFKMARSLTLLAAHAAGVPAIETIYANFRDTEGFRQSCIAARSEGFSGRLAIHPAQVEIINEAFLPSAEQIAHARRVIAAFAGQPGAGAVGMDGAMVDIPHKIQAEYLLARAAAFNVAG